MRGASQRVLLPLRWGLQRHNRVVLAAIAVAILCLGAPNTSSGATVLLITADATLTAGETSRKTQFESWGHTVTTLEDGASTSLYNAALAATQVVYVPTTVAATDVGYKLRTTTKGVVVETTGLDDEMGFATSDSTTSSVTQVTLVDANYGSGTITLFSSAQPAVSMQGTLAAGFYSVANLTSGVKSMGVIELGGALANTYSGNSTASGRRARLPWGGNSLNWSAINSNGLSLLQKALAWGARSALIGHWKFDETSGVAVSDSSGQGNNAAFSVGTPTWTTGPRDGALSFNGSNSAKTNASFNPPAYGSVAFWFRPNAAPSSVQRFFGTSTGWEIRYRANGTLQLDVSAIDGPITTMAFTEAGRWRHLVVNYDANADVYAFYVDGQLVQSGSFALTDEGAADLYFGTRNAASEYFNGSLDDFRVYEKQLTQQEISDLHGLVGHWTFDEGSGTAIADASGNGYHATFGTGTPAWVDGVRGKALEFNGANTAITTQSVSAPAEGTVAFWLRSDGPGTAVQRPFGIHGDWEARIGTDGILRYDLGGSPYAGNEPFSSVEALTTSGRWYHLTAVFDADDDSYSVYINGQLRTSGVSPVNLIAQSGGQLSFGTRTGSTERLFGALDDFRIYNRKLSVSEIAELYGLVGHWKFDETSGAVASDASGAGNHGTIAGTPAWTASGKVGGALEFDGANYVNVATQFRNPASVTLAGWAKLNDYDNGGSGTGTIVSLAEQMGLRLSAPAYASGLNGAHAYANGGASTMTAHDGVGYAGGGWRHFAAAFDSYAGTLSLYVDGVLVDSQPALSSIAYNNNLGTRIGSHAGSETTHDFKGLLDDVRVYNRALNMLEIRELFYGSYVPGVRIIRWVEVR